MMEAQEVEAQAATGSGQQQLKLYSYWMSSCSFRVRIALNLKGLKYEYKALAKGEQFSPEFRKLNPMGYVPVLVDGDTVVADSFAIILYLEEKYPQHPLLPPDLQKKAINYQKYIEEKVRPVEKLEWVQFHIGKGFLALEELLNNHAGKYATGDEVYMADLFLAPQLYAAITRFQLDMTQFPLLARLHEAYNKIPAFLDALPEKQPDAPS
ncbi:glutathione S-transferase zeta class-like isoform X5 [Malus sylvestris]|uniref:glutathione S-transferase zeta class-like isoform X5 n=1 Tax=Malus sylvestris TaxID=3752 RepID=UPI0010A9C99E|nr:glutathione S-transferase zeta class-like isoform X5 [Malus domestica]XP_050157894.1 glutathione S-transferase zeta class-like isoform X5 [Malus sylvestris]